MRVERGASRAAAARRRGARRPRPPSPARAGSRSGSGRRRRAGPPTPRSAARRPAFPGRRLATASTSSSSATAGTARIACAQQLLGRLVGGGVVEAGLLDRRADHRLAARPRHDVDVLARMIRVAGQRAAQPERLAFHGTDRQPPREPARRPRARGEHDAVGLDPRAVGELDAARVELDDVRIRAQRVAERARRARATTRRGSTCASAASSTPPMQSARCRARARGRHRRRATRPRAVAARRRSASTSEPHARVADVAELVRERRPELGRAARERGEAGRLRIGREHARGGTGRTAPGLAALEHADAQAALLRAPAPRRGR